MAATDGQIVIAAARWSSEDVLSLRDFLSQSPASTRNSPDNSGTESKCELVKIVRGQYSNLGVPNLPNPSLHSHAILSSLGKTIRVAAQSVKFKDGKRNGSVTSGVRFSIPESYPGYFEILSEEGKAVKCIESVGELTKKFPESVLVRDNVRGFVSSVPLQELSADKSRTINAGEILSLQKEVTLTRSSRSHRFLQCTDTKGDMVYLNLEQRGKFSPIARHDNISGVHTLRQLVTNKRLPLMVRLVWGPPPVKPGGGNAQPSCSELRLFSAYEEESLYALPLGLQHSSKAEQNTPSVVPLPVTTCNLKLVRARNHPELRHTEPFKRLANTATRLSRDINARMTVIETFKDTISFWNISPSHSKHAGAKISSKNYFLRRSVSHESQIVVSPIIQEVAEPEVVAPTQDFLEIDQIYDYVRGFAPLPKNLRSNNGTDNPVSLEAPQPPPIETIPTKIIDKKPHRSKEKQQHPQNKITKTSSKTALKMELHAQNLAQESLRSTERHEKSKKLFKSHTTSSLHPGGTIDLSTTHVLTQADLLAGKDNGGAATSITSGSASPTCGEVLEPTYENTTPVYLESPEPKKITASKVFKKATSEINHRLCEKSPKHECSKYSHSKRTKIPNGSHHKASKSHEDLVRHENNKKFAQNTSGGSCSSPGSPNVSETALHTSLTNLRCSAVNGSVIAEKNKSRRRRLSKQRSLSSLLASGATTTPGESSPSGGGTPHSPQSPHSPPVIEHRPVELHLHLSNGRSTQRHHSRGSGVRPAKLGILYL